MSLIFRSAQCSLLLCALGCSASSLPSEKSPSTPGQAPESPTTPQAASLKQPPLQSSLTGPAQPRAGNPLTLTAEIKRKIRIGVPVDVSLRLPPGVALTEGLSIQQLAPNAEADAHTLRFVIVAESIPSDDVWLVLDARGQGFGFHSEQAYRFGRGEPESALAPPLTRELKIGNSSAGPSVRLAPNGPQK